MNLVLNIFTVKPKTFYILFFLRSSVHCCMNCVPYKYIIRLNIKYIGYITNGQNEIFSSNLYQIGL